MDIWQVMVIMGIPTAITGFMIWWLKRHIEKKENKRAEQEKNKESLMIMILQNCRANSVLCRATAEAVRDGHCNGNMTHALEVMDKVQRDEKDFLTEQGIKHIFD